MFKTADKNKVSGHIAPNSVAVTMQGPGTVSLSRTPQVVGPDEDKPDDTIGMVKDAEGCKGPECSMVNVKSGKHKYNSRWALMCTHLFFNYSHQNWVTVSMPRYNVSTLHSSTKWYLSTWRTQSLITTVFCAVLGH